MRAEETDMKCAFCKGDLENRLVRYVQEYKGRVVIIDNVPAEVCAQCGEKFFAPDVAEKVPQIVWGKVSPARPIQAESYDFAQVA